MKAIPEAISFAQVFAILDHKANTIHCSCKALLQSDWVATIVAMCMHNLGILCCSYKSQQGVVNVCVWYKHACACGINVCVMFFEGQGSKQEVRRV